MGTVLLLPTDSLSLTDFRAEITRRVRGIPRLRRRLEQPSSRSKRPCWITETGAEAGRRIDAVTLDPGHADRSLRETADAFSEPTDPWRAPWAMLLVRGLPGRQTAIMVKVHHTLGGSQAIIAALTQLFDSPPPTSVPRRPARRSHGVGLAIGAMTWGKSLSVPGRSPLTGPDGKPGTADRSAFSPESLP